MNSPLAPSTTHSGAGGLLSPINQRRLRNFRANKRGRVSLWLFAILFLVTLFAELVANDRPIIASYKGELLLPAYITYPESKFGGFLATPDYRDPFIADEISANGWAIWPPVRFADRTSDNALPTAAPTPPFIFQTEEERCQRYPLGSADPDCHVGNWHWLGTDNNGHDVLARLIYGFRISVAFGLVLTFFSSIVGIFAGAVQGFFGGWADLIFQRFIEIWSSIPALYLLLIISSVIVPGFFVLLFILLLFSWVALTGVVRAEFLRARNFEYVTAARALGLSNAAIMVRHLLPNALVATLTFMPFILAGSVTTLTSLDFLGLGLPPGSPSLGELLAQGKQNVNAPWLGLTGFTMISLLLSLLVFIGEAVRDAFDPRKIFQ